VEEVCESALEAEGEFAVQEVQEGVDEGGGHGDEAEADDLGGAGGTRWMKSGRLRSTIALTMPPLTEAM
jgi:hypothetical protein